ncbi:hypothetical protein SVAN01_12011, partial [Stagonosporopsis vannaccii]
MDAVQPAGAAGSHLAAPATASSRHRRGHDGARLARSRCGRSKLCPDHEPAAHHPRRLLPIAALPSTTQTGVLSSTLHPHPAAAMLSRAALRALRTRPAALPAPRSAALTAPPPWARSYARVGRPQSPQMVDEADKTRPNPVHPAQQPEFTDSRSAP